METTDIRLYDILYMLYELGNPKIKNPKSNEINFAIYFVSLKQKCSNV